MGQAQAPCTLHGIGGHPPCDSIDVKLLRRGIRRRRSRFKRPAKRRRDALKASRALSRGSTVHAGSKRPSPVDERAVRHFYRERLPPRLPRLLPRLLRPPPRLLCGRATRRDLA